MQKREGTERQKETIDHLILLDPQAGPDGLLVAVKDGLDAAINQEQSQQSRDYICTEPSWSSVKLSSSS
jgi:hypothetical protein